MIKGAYTVQKGGPKSNPDARSSTPPHPASLHGPLQHPCSFSKHSTSMLTIEGTLIQGATSIVNISHPLRVFRTNQSHLNHQSLPVQKLCAM